ncbi:hypothetical protein ACFL35_15360 [Candidatus Riflebacteria bacterium]
MAACSYCGTTIDFGGIKDGNLKFCCEKCHTQGYVLTLADKIPRDILNRRVYEIREGRWRFVLFIPGLVGTSLGHNHDTGANNQKFLGNYMEPRTCSTFKTT